MTARLLIATTTTITVTVATVTPIATSIYSTNRAYNSNHNIDHRNGDNNPN